jgi:hypothetical protein
MFRYATFEYYDHTLTKEERMQQECEAERMKIEHALNEMGLECVTYTSTIVAGDVLNLRFELANGCKLIATKEFSNWHYNLMKGARYIETEDDTSRNAIIRAALSMGLVKETFVPKRVAERIAQRQAKVDELKTWFANHPNSSCVVTQQISGSAPWEGHHSFDAGTAFYIDAIVDKRVEAFEAIGEYDTRWFFDLEEFANSVQL